MRILGMKWRVFPTHVCIQATASCGADAVRGVQEQGTFEAAAMAFVGYHSGWRP